jgi:hypothetical protein
MAETVPGPGQALDAPATGALVLLAAPGTPYEVARALVKRLPRVLERHGHGLRPVLLTEDLLLEDGDAEAVVIAATRVRGDQSDSDVVICLTDVPLRDRSRPLVAAASPQDGVGVIAIPALGATRLLRSAEIAVVHLLDDLLDASAAVAARRARHRRLLSPARRVAEAERPAVRYSIPAVLGHGLLLAGMVRANRPWRALAGLSSAVIAAFATGAYALLTSTMWQLSGALGWARQTAAMLGAIVAVVVWLIVAHGLWERVGDGPPRQDRMLYNAATALTLTLAVAAGYLALFALIGAIGVLLIDGGVYRHEVGRPAGAAQYAALAWLGASIATVAGGLGSGLEGIEEVRDAAYGRHQQARSGGRDG